jgi:hypothetical protein
VVSSTNHPLRLAIAVCTMTMPYIANFLMKRWELDRVDGLCMNKFASFLCCYDFDSCFEIEEIMQSS